MAEKKGKAGAKALSRCAMCFATLWIVALVVLKGLGKVELEVDEIVMSGAAVVAMWCPAYVSMWLDKFKEIKSCCGGCGGK